MVACTYYYSHWMHNNKDMTKTMAYMTQQNNTVQQHNYLVVGEILDTLDALVVNLHL